MLVRVSSYQLNVSQDFVLESENRLSADVIQSILSYIATLFDEEFVYVGLTFKRTVTEGEIAFDFSPNINSK